MALPLSPGRRLGRSWLVMNLRQMPAAPPKKPKKVKLGLGSWETPGSKAVPRVAAVEKRMAKEGSEWEEGLARASEGRVQAKVGGDADVWRAVDGAVGWATHSTDHVLVT